MLIRAFTCAVCGAPRRTLDDAVIVICLHCGARARAIHVKDALALHEIATFDQRLGGQFHAEAENRHDEDLFLGETAPAFAILLRRHRHR